MADERLYFETILIGGTVLRSYRGSLLIDRRNIIMLRTRAVFTISLISRRSDSTETVRIYP